MLDLGRPERLIVAATHYNFTSVFAWNVFLYSGHVRDRRRLPVDADGAAHERLLEGGRRRRIRLAPHPHHRHRLDLRASSSRARPTAARCCRRCSSCCRSRGGWRCSSSCRRRCTRGTAAHGAGRRARAGCATCSASSSSARCTSSPCYHLTNVYFARQLAFERFILVDGGVYPLLFWGGYVIARQRRAARAALASALREPARRRWPRRCS